MLEKRRRRNGHSIGLRVVFVPLKNYYPRRLENSVLAMRWQWPIAVWCHKYLMLDGKNCSNPKVVTSTNYLFLFWSQIPRGLASVSNHFAYRSRTRESSSIPCRTSIKPTRLPTRSSEIKRNHGISMKCIFVSPIFASFLYESFFTTWVAIGCISIHYYIFQSYINIFALFALLPLWTSRLCKAQKRKRKNNFFQYSIKSKKNWKIQNWFDCSRFFILFLNFQLKRIHSNKQNVYQMKFCVSVCVRVCDKYNLKNIMKISKYSFHTITILLYK